MIKKYILRIHILTDIDSALFRDYLESIEEVHVVQSKHKNQISNFCLNKWLTNTKNHSKMYSSLCFEHCKKTNKAMEMNSLTSLTLLTETCLLEKLFSLFVIVFSWWCEIFCKFHYWLFLKTARKCENLLQISDIIRVVIFPPKVKQKLSKKLQKN